MWRGCSKSWARGGGPRRCARRGSWGWFRKGASFGAKSAESPVLTIAGRRGAGPNDASSIARRQIHVAQHPEVRRDRGPGGGRRHVGHLAGVRRRHAARLVRHGAGLPEHAGGAQRGVRRDQAPPRSEEHTSELQSLMRISYAVFCLNKKK